MIPKSKTRSGANPRSRHTKARSATFTPLVTDVLDEAETTPHPSERAWDERRPPAQGTGTDGVCAPQTGASATLPPTRCWSPGDRQVQRMGHCRCHSHLCEKDLEATTERHRPWPQPRAGRLTPQSSLPRSWTLLSSVLCRWQGGPCPLHGWRNPLLSLPGQHPVLGGP